jgi:Na+-translocating ferredoxin:NAD+ oxidoreductase RnfD subunit
MTLDRLKTQLVSFDPRLYQIASLSTLLFYGLVYLDFDVPSSQIAVTIATALLTQYTGTRYFGLPSFDPKSALISGLSLCLLLRTHDLAVAALAAFIAIGSKFVIRWKAKHVFNPTNLALVVMLSSGLGWISPGQWGQVAWFGFLTACLGSLVVTRAARADVTLAFLVFYVGLLVTLALWLGDPLAIPLHQIESGALLIFAFFMISDPKTTPDSRAGRITFAALVALAALSVQFGLFRSNGPLWGLIVCAPLVPIIDSLLPGSRYDWPAPSHGAPSALAPCPAPRGLFIHTHKGGSHDTLACAGTYVVHRSVPVGWLGIRVLRLLCGQGRHQAVQQSVGSRHRAP